MCAARLPRRPLGNTGLEVSVLGFGASPLGGVFEDIDEAEGIQSVHAAFRLGINFFDSSPFYGGTKSETVRPAAAVRCAFPNRLRARMASDAPLGRRPSVSGAAVAVGPPHTRKCVVPIPLLACRCWARG